jgi:hypothetical protein
MVRIVLYLYIELEITVRWSGVVRVLFSYSVGLWFECRSGTGEPCHGFLKYLW